MYQLGIDIGSTTIKMALVAFDNRCATVDTAPLNRQATDASALPTGCTSLAPVGDPDEGPQVIATAYERHNASPSVVGSKMLKKMLASVVESQKSKDRPSDSKLKGEEKISIAITGSVGMGYAARLGVPFVQEVIAAAEVVKQMYPEVHTLVDIGGEDSKMIFFERGRVPDMRMNGNCAGGTGAFIDQTATLLGVDVTEINGLAAKAEHVYPIASRCGVFSKTDIQNLISRSVSKEDIAASMLNAVSLQVVSALARGTEILPKVLLCGGPFAYIPELRKAIVKNLKPTNPTQTLPSREGEKSKDESQKSKDRPSDSKPNIADFIIVPEHSQFVPAIGTALAFGKKIAKGYTAPLNSQSNSASALPTGRAALASVVGPIFTIEEAMRLFDDKGEWTNGEMANTLPPLFRSEEEYQEWLRTKDRGTMYEGCTKEAERTKAGRYFLGVDSGSTTTKIVLLDAEGKLVYKDYCYNNGNSYDAFLGALQRMHEALGDDVEIAGSCSTGYGEQLLKTAFRLDYGIVETMAHFTAAKAMLPEVSFVLDIGGQDMKAIFVENGSIRRIEINEACSSGCGSFIMTFARQLGYEAGEFAKMATLAQHPYDLGTRCTVFMNSKVKQAMREGAKIDDIAAGFSYSVIKNCLYKVMKLQSFDEMGDHIMVQGGTFRNHSVVRALELLTGKDVQFSPIPELMGAYGCALYAKKRRDLEEH